VRIGCWFIGALVGTVVACDTPERAREPDPAVEPRAEREATAIRSGQCGFVEPGALRGGAQPMVLETSELGAGVPMALDSLQLEPVSGAWFCVLRTLSSDEPIAPPRRPVDLGRFRLLREERRSIEAAAAVDAEEWIHVTDPAWVEEIARRRRALEDAPERRRASLCEEAGRARVEPERMRDEAVTAMRHYVATGELPRPPPPPNDALRDHVRAIVELCRW
jgi:hypothetical protein